jgi:hypothetical protein
MTHYNLLDILVWTGAGYLTGQGLGNIGLYLLNPNKDIHGTTKIAVAYISIGLIAGSVKVYTGKSIVELIIGS